MDHPKFEALVELVRKLRGPDGCPWDRKQTHASLKPMLVEEAYEVIEAIDEENDRKLAEELGDLLLQVVFHAEIAREESRFDIDDVLASIYDKMVRRHPHVFGNDSASTPEEVLRNWEAIKKAERTTKGSMLDGVSKSMPALLEALQLTERAARVNFDWPDVTACLSKLDEEIAEFKSAITNLTALEDELGDLLFVTVNVARLLGIDPESALKRANRKFRNRFSYIEHALAQRGLRPEQSNLQEMDALWNEAKQNEKKEVV